MDDKPVPVVIVPPAFGKTKETLFGLALTLSENFRLLGKPLAVIRYDGIRKKGESHKDPEASEPPYEMLNTNFSQGAEDIVGRPGLAQTQSQAQGELGHPPDVLVLGPGRPDRPEGRGQPPPRSITGSPAWGRRNSGT